MANTGKLIGANYSICRDSGSFGSPAHIPIIAARDIKVNVKPAAVVDATDRIGSPLYEKVIPIMRNIELNFGSLWTGGTTSGIAVLKTSFLAGTPIRLSLLNARPQATTTGGGVGWRGDWLVKKISLKYPLKGASEADFTLCPHGLFTNAVSTYTDATTVLGTAETQQAKLIGYTASVNDSSSVIIAGIKDIGLDLEWDVMDATDRANASPANFEQYIPTRMKINLSINFQWKEDDTQLVAFRTAWASNAAIALSVLDQRATSGAWGVGAAGGIDWFVTDYPHDSPLTDGQMVSLKLQPAGNYTNALAFLTI